MDYAGMQGRSFVHIHLARRSQRKRMRLLFRQKGLIAFCLRSVNRNHDWNLICSSLTNQVAWCWLEEEKPEGARAGRIRVWISMIERCKKIRGKKNEQSICVLASKNQKSTSRQLLPAFISTLGNLRTINQIIEKTIEYRRETHLAIILTR